jgi:hypothetical protein
MSHMQSSYLLVAGTIKGGTTSLYRYLADHPEICASSVKETRFFLDRSHPLPAQYRFEDGLDKYESYFGHCQDRWLRMEATPHYLYHAEAVPRIAQSLPQVRLVFSLRDPITRLVSVYRFLRQNNTISADMTFTQYVTTQLDAPDPTAPPYMQAVARGCYTRYLQPYIAAFGHERICLIRFEDLKQTPEQTVGEICTFAGIDPHFYAGYDFQIYHQTQTMKTPGLHARYLHIRQRVRATVYDKPYLSQLMRSLQRYVEPLYLRLNKGADEQFDFPENLRARLLEYYQQEYEALRPVRQRDDYTQAA